MDDDMRRHDLQPWRFAADGWCGDRLHVQRTLYRRVSPVPPSIHTDRYRDKMGGSCGSHSHDTISLMRRDADELSAARVGVGLLVMNVGLYQAELSHPDIRGRIVALQQFMLGIGALVSPPRACFGMCVSESQADNLQSQLAAAVSYGTFVGISDNNDAQWQISLGMDQTSPSHLLPAGRHVCLSAAKY